MKSTTFGKRRRTSKPVDVRGLIQALRRPVVSGTVLPATRLSLGQTVQIGAMRFHGWVPRLQFAETEAQKDKAEEIAFMAGWVAPGQMPWLAIGTAGWSQEISV